MQEIYRMESNIMKDSLELKNAMKDEDDSENQMPNNLTQAV